MSLADAIAATKPDLIVPGDDLATWHLHHLYHRERRNGTGGLLCGLIERSLGAPESFPVVYARSVFMELAQAEGIRAPKTEVIRDIDDLRKWDLANAFPTVLKAKE